GGGGTVELVLGGGAAVRTVVVVSEVVGTGGAEELPTGGSVVVVVGLVGTGGTEGRSVTAEVAKVVGGAGGGSESRAAGSETLFTTLGPSLVESTSVPPAAESESECRATAVATPPLSRVTIKTQSATRSRRDGVRMKEASTPAPATLSRPFPESRLRSLANGY
ncbi:MAG: hypothetical protein M3314_10775, partial [Actinomycetota bacterium]|nr:hypothetical protein [Actinomycetota bacterium]